MTPRLAANLIYIAGWGFIIFGVAFVTISFPAYDGFAHSVADVFDWTSGPHEETLTRDARWFGAMFAGLTAGFGAFLTFLVAPLLTVSDIQVRKIAKRGALIGICIWFVVDSIGSIAAGVPSNAVINFIFLQAIMIPLLMVKF